MQVNSIDHVNIVCADLDASARFFAEVLGMERSDPPEPLSPDHIQWMLDTEGRPVVHLVCAERPDSAERNSTPGAPTGAFHHVAFECGGFDAMIRRLESAAVPFRRSDVAGIGLRQIFVTDPGNVLLELNFRGD